MGHPVYKRRWDFRALAAAALWTVKWSTLPTCGIRPSGGQDGVRALPMGHELALRPIVAAPNMC